MIWNNKHAKRITLLSFALAGLLLTACSISYSFSGGSIDYSKISSITISDFPNQAPLVYPPLAQNFTEELKDIYIRRTKLTMLPANGDLELEGEIIGYDLTPVAIKEDAYASQTKITLTIRVRYTNKSAPEEDFEQSFSANREFQSSQMLQDVQDTYNAEMVKEITEQIFNQTVANW